MFNNKIFYTSLIFFSVAAVGYFYVIQPAIKPDQKNLTENTVIKEVEEAQKLSPEKKSGLLLKSGLVELQNTNKPTGKKTHSIELDFFRLKDNSSLESESGFGQTYKKIQSFEISAQINDVEINFKEPVDNVASVVILVDEGAIDLKSFQLNNKTQKEDSKEYFKGDWIKRESLNPLKKVQFSSKPLTQKTAKVSLYVQYLGD